MSKFILGQSFFETHIQLQAEKNLDNDHVIVDRKDYDQVLEFLKTNEFSVENIQNNKFVAFHPAVG